MKFAAKTRQSGSVLIVTLWTIVLLSMLVLVLASEARVSAELSRSYLDRTLDWADTITAVNAAEMELLLDLMPEPAEDNDPEDDDDIRNPDFRFNGLPMVLEYAYPDSVEVRIYDHAGKINLRNLAEDSLELLLENLLEQQSDDGEVDEDLIEELLAAWGDWIDEDDGVRNLGAEEEYYLSLEQPYLPRQGQLETVEEILLIRGFDEVFTDLNLGAAFTLHSESELVNINIATPDALALLPGLNEQAIDAILAYRQEQDFTDFVDLEEIVDDEDELVELQSWIDFASLSSVYTILVVPKRLIEPAVADSGRRQPVFGGFARTVRVTDYNERPFVLRVDPMVRLPVLTQPLPLE